MKKSDLAVEHFYQGFNCAQSVLLAFAPELGLDREAARTLSSGFGGGMGGLRDKCGAVTATFMAAGLKFGDYDVHDNDAKTQFYAIIQQLDAAFVERFGTDSCRELLSGCKLDTTPNPMPRNEEYYREKPCARYVEAAAEILEKLI